MFANRLDRFSQCFNHMQAAQKLLEGILQEKRKEKDSIAQADVQNIEKALSLFREIDGYITPAHFNCWCSAEEEIRDQENSLSEINPDFCETEQLYIVLEGENGLYTFNTDLKSSIEQRVNCVALMEVEYDCTGGELIELCYGINNPYLMEETDRVFRPAFFMPVIEMKSPEKVLNDKYSVLGHIRFCLIHAKQLLEQKASHEEIEALRKESLGNFYVRYPISL